jgi:probable HAF family extracellular repeat protein
MHSRTARLLAPALALIAGAAQVGHTDAPERASVHYLVSHLSSLGGTLSSGNSINNLGWISGSSDLADQTRHAVLWLFGLRIDLRTLGGPNSNVVWPVKNTRGMITGIAETAEIDELGENWSCSAFFPSVTHHVCRGVVWEGFSMRPLPTLGGTHGFATGSNNHRQVVGWAETTVHHPTCTETQKLQFLGVVWGPGHNQKRALPPYQDDAATAATAINDRGQVVGISGACDRAVGRFSAAHAVLWEGNTVTNLGSLGGNAWNTPMAINQRGDIVGFANITLGAGFNAHGFLWTREGGFRPLRPLPGDALAQALGINEKRQVVGVSCTAGFASCRAVLWHDGETTDLNDLAPGYSGHLASANDINDFGVVTGVAIAPNSTERAFVAVPIPGLAASEGHERRAEVALSESVRQALMRRSFVRESDLE